MNPKQIEGQDCVGEFRAAYENRYTWEPDFIGYKGICSWTDGITKENGSFRVGKDLKASTKDIENDKIKKSIESQLWEVAIHRVKRSFTDTHGENTFTYGNLNSIGMEVIVGGKNKGDKYRIKDNVVTMVHRHIHGSLITIYTEEVINTGKGYLSKRYSSQYINVKTHKPLKPKNFFEDQFVPLFDEGPWVLSKRVVKEETKPDQLCITQTFSFDNMQSL